MIFFEILAAVFFTSIMGVLFDILYSKKDPYMIRGYQFSTRKTFIFTFFRSTIIIVFSIIYLFKEKRSLKNLVSQFFFLGSMFSIIHAYLHFNLIPLGVDHKVTLLQLSILAFILWVIIFAYIYATTTFLQPKNDKYTALINIDENIKESYYSFGNQVKRFLIGILGALISWQTYVLATLTLLYMMLIGNFLNWLF